MSARFQGQGVSPGTAVGPVYLVRDTHTTATAFRGLEDELRALDAAVAESAAQLGGVSIPKSSFMNVKLSRFDWRQSHNGLLPQAASEQASFFSRSAHHRAAFS